MASPFLAQPNQPLSPFFPHAFPLPAQLPADRPGPSAEIPAKWTSEEHSKFLRALEDLVSDAPDGSDWQAIAQAVGRTEADVKRHAQHYFLKLEHERSIPEELIIQVVLCACQLALVMRVCLARSPFPSTPAQEKKLVLLRVISDLVCILLSVSDTMRTCSKITEAAKDPGRSWSRTLE